MSAVMVMVMLTRMFMNVTMVLTAMVNSGGSAFLVVFVAVISYCGGDRF